MLSAMCPLLNWQQSTALVQAFGYNIARVIFYHLDLFEVHAYRQRHYDKRRIVQVTIPVGALGRILPSPTSAKRYVERLYQKRQTHKKN